jgi:hypothetical protein
VSGQLHAPEPVWTAWRRENSWSYRDSNSDPAVVQPVASRYTAELSNFPILKGGVYWDVLKTRKILRSFEHYMRNRILLARTIWKMILSYFHFSSVITVISQNTNWTANITTEPPLIKMLRYFWIGTVHLHSVCKIMNESPVISSNKLVDCHSIFKTGTKLVSLNVVTDGGFLLFRYSWTKSSSVGAVQDNSLNVLICLLQICIPWIDPNIEFRNHQWVTGSFFTRYFTPVSLVATSGSLTSHE